MSHVIPWKAPPFMMTGTPFPVIRIFGDSLIVAYVCHNPQFPGWDSGATVEHPCFDVYSAVLRYERVAWHHFGAPNHHSIPTHPLYADGLRSHGFWEVLDSPREVSGLHHWIATFHEQTLEVVAESAHIVTDRHEGEDTQNIITQYA